MARPAIAADVHQPLDVHRDFGAQRTLDLDGPLDELAKPRHLGVGQVAHPRVGADAGLREDPAAGGAPDAEDVRQGDFDALFARKVHACNACHDQPCRCLCLGLRLQMTRTTPCRLTTLQCSQIGLTLERTFTESLQDQTLR